MNLLSLRTFKKYIFSILLSIVITLILLAVISVIFSFFPPSQGLMETTFGYSYIIPAFISAFFCARNSSGKGLLTGIITAVICILLISLSFAVFFKRLPLGLLMGAIGGVAGINSK